VKERSRKTEDGKYEVFDLAIDLAVREMLDVEPAADLRARVIARIAPHDAGQLSASSWFSVLGSGFSVLRFGVLVGAAALLVLLVILVRRVESPTPRAVVADAAGRVSVEPATPAIEHPVPRQPVESSKRTAVASVPMPERVAYAASIDATNAAPGIDPLTRITPIEVAPIAQTSITPAPIGVRPLTPIPEMQIAPLNPPDGRN